jgi:hypothetical protein
MRTRMILLAVSLLFVAGCGSNSPTGPSVNAPERPLEGGYMGSGD